MAAGGSLSQQWGMSSRGCPGTTAAWAIGKAWHAVFHAGAYVGNNQAWAACKVPTSRPTAKDIRSSRSWTETGIAATQAPSPVHPVSEHTPCAALLCAHALCAPFARHNRAHAAPKGAHQKEQGGGESEALPHDAQKRWLAHSTTAPAAPRQLPKGSTPPWPRHHFLPRGSPTATVPTKWVA